MDPPAKPTSRSAPLDHSTASTLILQQTSLLYEAAAMLTDNNAQERPEINQDYNQQINSKSRISLHTTTA